MNTCIFENEKSLAKYIDNIIFKNLKRNDKKEIVNNQQQLLYLSRPN
jgi:hypothetical protein